MAIRRVRRAGAAGTATNPSAPLSRPERRPGGMMARGDEERPPSSGGSVSSKSKSLRRGTNGPSAAGGGGAPPPMSLSEKLRQQELLEEKQQDGKQANQSRGRGPLMDSDHMQKKSGNEDDSAGWSWASSSRGTNNKSAGGKMLSALGGGKLAMSNAASSLPSPFGDKKRNANAATKKVMSVVNCAKKKEPHFHDDEDDDWENHTPDHSNRVRMIKLGLVVSLVFWVVFQIGRRRGHRLREEDYRDPSGLAFASPESSSSLSMSDQFLRGNLPSFDNLNKFDKVSSLPDGAGEEHPLLARLGGFVVVHQASFPPHLGGLSNLTSPYDPMTETPYFWDVHFSGESVAEVVFSECHGLVQAAEFGLRQPDYNEEKLEVFQLEETQYVNVDTTTPEGIQRASQLRLASSHLADVIISPHFHMTTSQIFSPSSPGRMFALFRHPVDRALSMYYYLAKATWDPHYNPALSKMSVEQYAKSRYIENNWLTRFLVGRPGGKLKHADMLLAKKIVKFKCLVGLYDDIEVSMARFQRYFGWSSHYKPDKGDEAAKCRAEAVLRGDKNVKHPTVREGSRAWNAIARMNVYDMELYEYAKKVYSVQGEQIFDVVGHKIPDAPRGDSAGGDFAMGAAGEELAAPPGWGENVGMNSFEKEVFHDRSVDGMAFDSAKEEPVAPLSGKSMADAFEEGLFDAQPSDDMASGAEEEEPAVPQSGKSMAVDAFEHEPLEPPSDGMLLDRV